MDVLERIERGEITVTVGINNSNVTLDEINNAKEILRLARLGAAALKTQGTICVSTRFQDSWCREHCKNYDFCRIRKEGGE